MRDSTKNPGSGGGRIPGETSEVKQMSLCKFIKRLRKSQYFRDLFFKIIDYAFWAYIMFAGIWTICWLVGKIFKAMGVG